MSEKNISEKDFKPDVIIDAKGLLSPIPLLRLKRELATMQAGDKVRIDCTDTSCAEDIANWCSRMSYTFLGEKEQPEYTSYFITK